MILHSDSLYEVLVKWRYQGELVVVQCTMADEISQMVI